jgi:ParB family chromosome partitioning protein
MLELALVENIQREDLDAIEVAISYQRLIDECQLTQENVSERVGKKRSTVTNYLRLLKLPAEVQLAIRQRQLSMGHARALVNIDDTDMQLQLLHDIIENEMSVRQIENAVRQMNQTEQDTSGSVTENSGDEGEVIYEDPRPPVVIPEDNDQQFLKDQLSKYFSTKVDLKRDASGAGRIVITFRTDDELQHILQMAEKISGQNI